MDGSKSKLRRIASLAFFTFLATNFTQTLAFERILEKAKIDGIDTHDLDIFIESKIRYLHAKVDLKPAVLGLLTLNKCVIQLSKGAADSLDSALSKLLEKRVTRISDRLYRITGKEHVSDRRKRSIEFIGDLISDIFGNPGPADWKKVNANILALQGALKRVEDNTEINHADIDTDRHVIEQHNKEIKSLSSIVNRNQNELSNINAELHGLKTFFEISTLADTLDSLTLSLLEVKNNGMRGFCSDRVISKDFLIENIQSLEANRAGISPIFGSWEWRNYYRFEMCTLALVKDTLWVTIRIPLVRRSERLIRVIPSFSQKKVIDRADLYGIKTVLFREKDNDKFHLMTLASFEMCNSLGNVRTCGVRESRFGSMSQIIAVEFMHDHFLIASNKLATLKITEKCPNMVKDTILDLDSVIVLPPNCSYTSADLYINTREADVEITKEVGITSVDKLEITKIENYHENVTRIFVEAIANRSSSGLFEKNKKEIREELSSIDTKHDNSWKVYNIEKWVIVGTIGGLIIVLALLKVRSSMVAGRVRSTTFNEIAELRTNLRLTQNEFRQETIDLQEMSLRAKHTNEIAVQSETELTGQAGVNNKTLSFSSPMNRSQFL